MGRHAGKDLRNLNAGNVGFDRLERPADGSRRVRLHIPGIQLAGPTHQHQMDTVHVLAGLYRTHRLEAEEVGHRQPQEPERSRVQKVPPADTVTEMNSLVSIQSKHRSLSQPGQWGNHRPLLPKTLPTPNGGTLGTILLCLYDMELCSVL